MAVAAQLPLMAISIASDGIEETLAGIEETWNEFVTETPFEYTFLDERLDRLYTSGIVLLLSRSFSKWALPGNIIAWPLAFVLANRWLDNFAYKMSVQWYTFVIAGGLTLVIALVTVSHQAIRASLANPVDALKCE